MAEPKEITFRGIDGWHRPVFQGKDSMFYGSTDILFSFDATEDEVLAQVTEADLTYFGRSFGCEPWGSDPGNIKIIRKQS